MFGNPNLKLPTVAMFLSMAFLMGELFRTPSPNILKKCAPLIVSIEIGAYRTESCVHENAILLVVDGFCC